MHRLVARLALWVHLGFVGFTILGGFLAWLMPSVLLPHIASAAWSARQGIQRTPCPLSRLENWGRRGAGREEMHHEGFIKHYFEGRVYPQRWARRVELGVLTVVLTSWLGFTLK